MKMTHRKGALVASALILGMIAAQSANAQIRTTKHNFSGGGVNSSSTINSDGGNLIHVKAGDNNDEICVYCHTPHGANMNVTAPLWNKSLSPAAVGNSYTTYSSGTMQGDTTGLASTSAKHMSLACLACHDGTQAMDNMINASGSDGFNSDGGGSNGGGNGSWETSGTFGSEVNAQGFMQGNASNTSALGLSSSNGVTNYGGTVAMLSPDLSNDHPIAMQYCGGNVGSAGSAASCNDEYFHDANVSGGSWYVPNTNATVSIGTGAGKGLRLYAAAGGGATVECGSCHDPHTATTTFLRLTGGNVGSQVCLTCHDK